MKNVLSLGEQHITKPSQSDEQSAIWASGQKLVKEEYKFRGSFENWKQQYAKHYSH